MGVKPCPYIAVCPIAIDPNAELGDSSCSGMVDVNGDPVQLEPGLRVEVYESNVTRPLGEAVVKLLCGRVLVGPGLRLPNASTADPS